MQKVWIIIITFLLLSFSAISCAEANKKEVVTAFFVKEGGKQTQSFSLQISKTNAERQQGLMNVKSMPSTSGMLFIFPDEKIRYFWMKNTFISLDIIFLDKNFKVIGIAPRTRTLSEKSISVFRPSKYVVELNAGITEKLGIKEGSTLKVLKELPEAIE